MFSFTQWLWFESIFIVITLYEVPAEIDRIWNYSKYHTIIFLQGWKLPCKITYPRRENESALRERKERKRERERERERERDRETERERERERERQTEISRGLAGRNLFFFSSSDIILLFLSQITVHFLIVYKAYLDKEPYNYIFYFVHTKLLFLFLFVSPLLFFNLVHFCLLLH